MRPIHRNLLIVGALLLLAGGGFAWQQLQQRRAAAEQRRQLLADVDQALQQEAPDASELAALKLALERLPDHQSDRAAVLARARIERARQRDQVAWEVLAPSTGVDAGAAELRLGAELLLRLHARSGQREQARQARDLARRAYALSHDAADLLLQWQAEHRTGAAAEEEATQKQLLADHANSKEARLCAALQLEGLEALAGEVRELMLEFVEPPVELGMARAVVLIREGDLAGAGDLLERLADQASALVDVRHLGAVQCHAVAADQQQPLEVRHRALERRNAHLNFCLEHAAADDPRRQQWQDMLSS